MAGVLTDRCAIVTGASRGLGFAIARKYVEAGASVMICASEPELLERARRELGGSVLAQVADVSKPHDVDALVEQAAGEFGRLDVLVNNAGVAGPVGPVDDVDWHGWLQTLEINLLGAVLLSRAVLPHFKRAKYG